MDQDIQLAKKLFMATRESIIEAVEMHLNTSANKKGVHSRRGMMNMKQLIEFLIWHTDNHIKQIKKIKPANNP